MTAVDKSASDKANQHSGLIWKCMGAIADLLDEAERNEQETGPLLYDQLRGQR